MHKTYAFGVDLGGTTTKIGLFKTCGDLIEMWEIPTRTEQKGKHILNDIANALTQKIQQKNISKDDIEGVGIGVPGPVGEDGTVFQCVNLGWEVFNVQKELNKIIGLKVKVGNDANVAALGEMWQGGGKGYKSIVMITLGTGVGGGVIINNRIICGANGAAGEVGHIRVDYNDTTVCACGCKGCLELYGSATGVVRSAKKYMSQHPNVQTSLKKFENIEAKDIFDCAKNGDETSLKIVYSTCEYLARGLSIMACAVNPEAFVIGGGMSKAGEILIEHIRKNFEQNVLFACKKTEFKLATLGNNAGIYGSMYMLIS